MYNTASKIIVTCNRRLSAYLEKEIIALGYTPVKVFLTGVELQGTMQDCIKLNLNLRCASQVLLSIKEFYCDHPEDLYDAVLDINWTSIITSETYFSITSNVFHDSINNGMYANVKVKDAIVDVFKDKGLERPSTGPLQDAAVIHLHWKHEDAELFLDTSGETLAKHGYRRFPGRAPMLESLAACTIVAGKWDRASHFVNPMCGSGTLAIEAALMASNRAPGLLRNNYSFMYFVGYQEAIYLQEKEIIKNQIQENNSIKIIASDISNQAIEVARANAEIAEVDHLIDFQICDFRDTQVPQHEAGVVYINPEYGERLGEIEQLEITYKAMGDFLKQSCQGYNAYIFTGNLDLAKKIGLKASRRIEFYNGKIDCRLLEYEMYRGTKREVEK
ncbi:MAG: class I SAM-dependent RNA methyltransferase [Chitinophagaceae bacterium]|nr:class I SAM-dependent RNA methyltransferase [Chitinophagaceae bacterium]